MSDRELRKRCQKVVDELDIPKPFDLPELIRRLTGRLGRPVHLLPMPLQEAQADSTTSAARLDRPCGLLLSTATYHALLYEKNTSQAHQFMIIGHELGHLLLGHNRDTMTPELSLARVLPNLDTAQLLPDLDPDYVRSVLFRTAYSEDQERHAEMVGTLLLRNAEMCSDPHTVSDPNVTELVNRLRRSFEHPGR